jgi:hypothetical protein
VGIVLHESYPTFVLLRPDIFTKIIQSSFVKAYIKKTTDVSKAKGTIVLISFVGAPSSPWGNSKTL